MAVGRVVALDTRDPRFESSLRQLYLLRKLFHYNFRLDQPFCSEIMHSDWLLQSMESLLQQAAN